MKKKLHDSFLLELSKHFPRKVDMVNFICDEFAFEKEAIYRRLSGKVNFTADEMGVISKRLDISLDNLLYEDDKFQRVPFIMNQPLQFNSMDSICNSIEATLQLVENMNNDEPTEHGCIYNILPLEFIFDYPLLWKFCFFRLGYYFVKSDEFKNFNDWALPIKLFNLSKKIEQIYNYRKVFYIWDISLLWSFCLDIENFMAIDIINTQEGEDIKNDLKKVLFDIEKILDGTYRPQFNFAPETDFYVSNGALGFSGVYYQNSHSSYALVGNTFNNMVVNNARDNFDKVKGWIKSFQNISTHISGSGRRERKLFFDNQRKILDKF